MSQLLMLDSIEVSQFAGLRFDALAGYVGGSWPDYSQECAVYPALHAKHRIISIAVNASEDAEFLDCEKGDARPDQCGPWLRRQLNRGVWHPGIYGSFSDWHAISNSIAAERIGRMDHRRWGAGWVYYPALAAGFDAQQWTDRYLARNIDASQTLDTFFQPAAQPPHKNTPNYDIFPTSNPRGAGERGGPFPSSWGKLDERNIVLHYDGAREHPVKYARYIAKLEAQLKWLSRRVAYLAIFAHPLPGGVANWKLDHLGARYQALSRRAVGQRFA